MSAPQGPAQAVWQVLRGWRWQHSAWACFIGLANLVCNGTPLGSPDIELKVFNALAYNVLQFGFPLVFLVGLAEPFIDAGRLPMELAYLAVVVLTVLLGVWVFGPMLEPLLGTEPWWNSEQDVRLATTSFCWLLLGTLLYAQRRANRLATQQREQAEAAHAAQQRELAAAQLLALQARVDPELLFERLRTVDAELQSDPDLARRRLSTLIDLLRLLQPHQDARVSSLGREFEGAALLARLLGRDAQQPERLLLHLPPELAAKAFAPSVLLPLLRSLLAAPGTLWSVRSEAVGPMLRLQVAALGPDERLTQAAAGQVPLAELRERLQAVLGPTAALTLQPDPLPHFELTWPAS
jgi:hypothetical protein